MADSNDIAFDYIVVGGGLAGCAVAARLSERPSVRVALIEAGGENRYEASYYATGAHAMFETDANWRFETVPQAALGGARIPQPRGKVIGGSAAINIGSWSRGIAEDYDEWEAAGATGWNWESARRQFVAIETSGRPDRTNRGRRGPLVLEDTPVVSEMTARLRQACIEAGYGATDDHNGLKFDGFDLWETIFQRGRRRNTAEAYLAPARIRNNLAVITRAHATRIDVEDGRAVGITVDQDGRTLQIKASGEVVLCCGAFGTPQLLMLSGIGPGGELRAHGIEVVADVSGVGANLIDHLATRLGWASSKPGGIAPVYNDPGDAEQLRQWRRNGEGPLSANPNTSIAFIRSSETVRHPDVELLFGVNPPEDFASDPGVSGFTAYVAHVKPKSRGTLRLSSSNPFDAPLIDPGYLSDPSDLPVLVAGVRRSLALAATSVLRRYAERSDLPQDVTDEGIAAWIRGHSVSMYHPVGTTRMGSPADAGAVLDPELRVRGVDKLRVLDASAMPGIIRGHTMAPTLFIAERGAELIERSSRG